VPGLFNSCRKTPALQLGKLYDDVGLRLTGKDKNDWIPALDLLIQAALTRVAVAVTAT
jgi:hypothetical protein